MQGIYISELLPNPVGKDTGNEWIEVCNKGTQTRSLAGWKLQDASGKTFTIGNVSLAPKSCVVFGNTETKISLNNDTETVSLFDTNGILIDKVSYSKAVKDDQALARVSVGGELQITTTPTKGVMENKIIAPVSKTKAKTSTIVRNKIQDTNHKTWSMEQGVQDRSWNMKHETVLVSGTNLWEPILIGVCVAGVLAVVFVKIAAQFKQKTEDKNKRHSI